MTKRELIQALEAFAVPDETLCFMTLGVNVVEPEPRLERVAPGAGVYFDCYHITDKHNPSGVEAIVL